MRDLATGKDLADASPTPAAAASGAPTNDGFFYTRLDDNHRPSKIFFHALGTDAGDDRLVYEETDPGFFMSVGGTRSNDWIIDLASTTTRPRNTGSSRPAIRRPSRSWCRRARPASNTISRKAATSSSS